MSRTSRSFRIAAIAAVDDATSRKVAGYWDDWSAGGMKTSLPDLKGK
ncbi:hypothetical protein ACWCXB_33370 [Streptomyces sp. NPDC001514]